MAQHDYVISDQSGLSFLSDINSLLAAIASQNSGATEPSPAYAYMPWADTSTTPATLKVRNAANNGWVVIGSLGDATLGLLSRSGGSMTGALLAAYGTIALPGLAFAGDADTGIVRLGANMLGIVTAGIERADYGTTEVVFNDGGNDYDFRVEGDTNPNLFKIDAALDQVQVANLNGGPLAGFRNLLINGNPTINQRGYVSGTATTGTNQYTLDRWRVVVSGQSISWTDSAGVRTVTAPAGGVEQVIEGASVIGGTYTLNWTGTATATVGGTSVAKGGTVTLTGGTNATARFSGGTFALPQLEPGPVATPFERRPIGTELALCQRYFETSYPAGTAVGAASDASGAIMNVAITVADFYTFGCLRFAVAKRAAPSVTIYNPVTGAAGGFRGISDSSNNIATSAMQYIGNSGVGRIYAGSNNLTTGFVYTYHYTASAEL